SLAAFAFLFQAVLPAIEDQGLPRLPKGRIFDLAEYDRVVTGDVSVRHAAVEVREAPGDRRCAYDTEVVLHIFDRCSALARCEHAGDVLLIVAEDIDRETARFQER